MHGLEDSDERKIGEEEAGRPFVAMVTSPGNNQRDNRKHSHRMCLHEVLCLEFVYTKT